MTKADAADKPMTRMDYVVKEAWVDALRSGDYFQIRGQLGDEANGRCCLGVLADVVDIPSECLSEENTEGDELLKTKSLVYQARLYVDKSNDRSELYHDFPSVGMLAEMGSLGMSEAQALAQMNDDGHGFAEIADFIEKKL